MEDANANQAQAQAQVPAQARNANDEIGWLIRLIYDDNMATGVTLLLLFLSFTFLGIGFFTQTDFFQYLQRKEYAVYVDFGLIIVCMSKLTIGFLIASTKDYCTGFFSLPKTTFWQNFVGGLKFIGYALSLASSVLMFYDDEHKIYAILSCGFYSAGLFTLSKLGKWKSDHGIVSTTVGIFMVVGFAVLKDRQGRWWKSFLVLLSATFLLWSNDYIVPPPQPRRDPENPLPYNPPAYNSQDQIQNPPPNDPQNPQPAQPGQEINQDVDVPLPPPLTGQQQPLVNDPDQQPPVNPATEQELPDIV